MKTIGLKTIATCITTGALLGALAPASAGADEIQFARFDYATGEMLGYETNASTGTAIANYPNGDRAVVAGCEDGQFTVTRYSSKGKLDTSFNGTGKVVAGGTNGCASAVAVQSDGKIVVAGTSKSTMPLPCVPPKTGFCGSVSYTSATVLRYHANGTPDASFNSTGRTSVSFGTNALASSRASKVAVQKDGKIVVAGTVSNRFGVVRLTKSGLLDSTFDGDGRATAEFPGATGSALNAMAIDSKGRVVVGGTDGNVLTMARFLPGGGLDGTFGTAGTVRKDFSAGTAERVLDLAINSTTGRIRVVGGIDVDTQGELMLKDHRTLVTVFGNSGMLEFSTVSAEPSFTAKIVGNEILLGASMGVARLNADGGLVKRYSFYRTPGGMGCDYGIDISGIELNPLTNRLMTAGSGYCGIIK